MTVDGMMGLEARMPASTLFLGPVGVLQHTELREGRSKCFGYFQLTAVTVKILGFDGCLGSSICRSSRKRILHCAMQQM